MEAEVSLRENFGATNDEIAGVRDTIVALGGEELLGSLIDAGFANDANVADQFIQLARENADAPVIAALRKLIERQITPEAAELEADELLDDPEFQDAWGSRAHRGHKLAHARYTALTIAANPPDFLGSLK